jgi:hypothetical protein
MASNPTGGAGGALPQEGSGHGLSEYENKHKKPNHEISKTSTTK